LNDYSKQYHKKEKKEISPHPKINDPNNNRDPLKARLRKE